jgi:hypothetical protein
MNEVFAVTLDLQHLDDKYKSGAGDDVDGWITCLRLTAEFKFSGCQRSFRELVENAF